jgi:hypothetical protein
MHRLWHILDNLREATLARMDDVEKVSQEVTVTKHDV